MSPTFNLKDVKEPSYAPVPEDRYEIEVINVDQGTTHAGDVMLNIKFSILTPEKYKGRHLWANMSLGPKAIGFFKVFLAAAESPLVDAAEATVEVITEDLIGRHVSCVAIPGKTPTGKDKNDLRNWMKIKNVSISEKDDDVTIVS